MPKKLFTPEVQDSWHLENLTNPKAKKAYDKYLKDHARRLRQLERELAGEAIPGDERNYDE